MIAVAISSVDRPARAAASTGASAAPDEADDSAYASDPAVWAVPPNRWVAVFDPP
jgi:hypothetical protein